MKISHLDHLVLTVADIPTTTNFYEKVLGMKAVSFGAGRIALEFGHQKINLHQLGNEFEPKAQNVRVGSADLCFITDIVLSDAMKHGLCCVIRFRSRVALLRLIVSQYGKF